MKTQQNNWTKAELTAYLLLYCASADFVTTAKELDLAKTGVDRETFNRLATEIEQDNDKTRIDKIQMALSVLSLTKDEKTLLLQEMKLLLTENDEYLPSEQAQFLGLRRILLEND